MDLQKLIDKAKQGDAEAQFQLGMAYYNGDGVEENHEMAFEWWMKAAEQEVPGAMYNLGIMYRDGDGVEQDLFNAMYWFGKAYRYGMKEAKKEMDVIQLWIVKECGETISEKTSAQYAEDVESFIKEKGEKIDHFVADCKERKKYKPESFLDYDFGHVSTTIHLNVYPYPTSIKQKGFKEYLLGELLRSSANDLWEMGNRECAFAFLDASIEVVKELSEPWVPHEWMWYYSHKAEFYMQEQEWEKAELALRDILGYRSICNMSQFATDDENIYEGMSQDELEDFCDSEWIYYCKCVSLMYCLIQQDKMDEAQTEFADFYAILENRIKRQDSYEIYDWLLNELKNEDNSEVEFNFIRILKQFGLPHVWCLCQLFCEKLEKEMNENGVGNGYQWSREQYEVVERMYATAIPYVEQAPHDELQREVLMLLTIYKGEYLMQTRRFVLAEKLFLKSLEMSKENKAILAEVIGLFDDLYRVQNMKAEKNDFLLSLMDLFTEDEKRTECYLTLCEKLKGEQ